MIALSCLALFLPAMAQAACYVEYKAKQDSPLRLHYGISRIASPCPSAAQAGEALRARLARDGWTLLNVVGLSGQEPSDKKKANAGDYYLRY